ncbi:MAG: hypothetical protein IJS32_03025 [Kiritimatiellae bacterium]|nr:hypothetical protein [Kiritimatiellia bacterium]
MSRRSFWTAAAAAALALASAAQDLAPIDEATFDGSAATLRWQSDPGTTYRVTGRSSLTDPDGAWALAGGYVSGSGWSLGETIATGTNRMMFFRVEKVDQEGPAFEFLSPAPDAVSVPADTPVRIAVSDPGGVSEEGLAIYIGGERHLFGEDPAVSWEDGVLSYAGGALGAPGERVEIWATATDLAGNTAGSASSLVVLASDLRAVTGGETGTGEGIPPFVVIGSGAQAVEELAEATARATGASAASASAGSIEVLEAGDGFLLFAFTGDGWKLPAAGQLWASSDPAIGIFYRRIESLDAPDEEAGTVRASTSEATLADFFAGGSFSSDDGAWSEYDVEDAAPSASSRRTLARPCVSGGTARRFSTNGVISSDRLNAKIPARVPLAFEGDLGSWDVSAGFSVAADFGILKRKFNSCDLAVDGQVHLHLNPKLVATTNAAFATNWSWTVAEAKKTFGGTIGPVPIWVDLGVTVPVELSVQAQATNASVAAVIDIVRALDYHWKLSDDVWKQVGSGNPGWVIAETNFTYEVEGSAGVRVAVKPTVTVKVYSLIGAYGWVEPYLECNATGRVQGRNLAAPDFYYLLTAYAGLNAEIGLASTIWSDSWGDPPHKTFPPLRKQLLHLEGTNTPPRIVTAPENCEAADGDAVMLAVEAEGTRPLRYAWYHNGIDTGRRETFLVLSAGEATAGTYTVRVSNGYGTEEASAVVSLATNVPVAGLWRFRYQWEGEPSREYAARFYADGTMHDTSPSDHWWDWHVNGATVRFETRDRFDGGVGAVYRGTRKEETYMSGTMTSCTGVSGTWSMTRCGADPDGELPSRRAARGAEGDEAPALDPIGFPFPVAVP